MAQLVGDGPNRGQSASSARRLPKPAPERRTIDSFETKGPQPDWTRARQPEQPREKRGLGQWKPALPMRGPLVAERAKQEGGRQQQADSTAAMYDNMAARQRKDEKRLQREKKDRKESSAPMTADEWAILSPLQQAAVQANADLAGAIERDFKTQGKHTANSSQGEGGTERIQSYMKQVDDLFGEDGSVGYKGLEFAPNTLAFLKERGIDEGDLGGRTLDDLVSGDTLFTKDQISALGKADQPQSGSDLFKVQSGDKAFLENVARGQLQYQENIAAKLAKGNQLLTDTTGRSTNMAAGDEFGAKQDESLRLDAVQPQTMQQIDMYMEALARPDSPIDEALKAINLDLEQRGVSTKEAEQVFQELSNRSRQGVTGEGKWFDGLDFPMRSPQEVAQALGAPTLKRRQTTGTGG